MADKLWGEERGVAMSRSSKRAMTKSPVALARVAMEAAQQGLSAYSNRFSRRDYTQQQLFAILVLRQFFRTDYRGIVQLLRDFSDLREALGLQKIPHYSTLCYAHQRLLKKRGLSAFSITSSI
ncbi:MAG: transposase [Planctomycetota bacterium]|jgi:hypothetical protein